MRIHVSIPPSLLSHPSSAGSPLLAKLGSAGTVLIELQGSLESDGDTSGRLIGTLGLEGDRPTLRIAHHLLHGTFVKLPKPLAVLRRAPRPAAAEIDDADDDSDSSEDEQTTPTRKETKQEKDRRLPPSSPPSTATASSPMPAPSSEMPDYSSDLDPMSSPVKGGGEKRSRAENENDDDGSTTPTRRRPKRPKTGGGGAAAAHRVRKSELRTMRYDCIAVIRTKVVFGKRPQPVVNLHTEDVSS